MTKAFNEIFLVSIFFGILYHSKSLNVGIELALLKWNLTDSLKVLKTFSRILGFYKCYLFFFQIYNWNFLFSNHADKKSFHVTLHITYFFDISTIN